MSDRLNPCRELCILRYNKEYSQECDDTCEFAAAMKPLKTLDELIEKIESIEGSLYVCSPEVFKEQTVYLIKEHFKDFYKTT